MLFRLVFTVLSLRHESRPVHLRTVERRQAAEPLTKPTDLGRESALD